MTAQDWTFPRAEALPPYAFVVSDAVKARVRATGADIIDLGLGNPDRPTPPEIVARLHATADTTENHRYHPGRGLSVLRNAAAAWYARRYGVHFDVEREVIITMGAKEGMSHLCFATLDRGDVAIVPDPCYPIHAYAPQIAGATVEYYPATTDIAPAKAIADAISRVAKRGQRAKLVIANYPQNPTGQVISPEELAELVRTVQKSGAMLLHDLAYADFDFARRFAPSIFDCGVDREVVKAFAVEVYSMSKSYNMPGWRIAYMVGNERMVGALAHMKTYLDYGTFAPLQLASAWALEHGDRFASEIRDLYKLRATALVAGLRGAGWPNVAEPSGTMFVWTKIPPAFGGRKSLAVTTELIESAHVAVAPGVGFGAGGDDYLRFALIEDPPRVNEACARLARFFKTKG
ncbi:MAG TPA: aminotransferase class I/II-fold pyridoxal phosphate-dependent enzyme [Polyangiaceae bacterium]|nr:aminotransferase class I/II-fold pyridoxal phosphate-dependent enzyme [Polyangiaceae bacterium]